MSVAKELGYSLARLTKEICYEELILWGVFFDLYNEEQEAAARRRRR